MTRDEEIAIEWDCQKVLRHYYHLVDQKRYEEAVQIFTPDIEWWSMGVKLKGHDDILKALEWWSRRVGRRDDSPHLYQHGDRRDR